jgi:hypothetical protein
MKMQLSLIRGTLVSGLTIAAAILPQTALAQYSSPVRVTNTKTDAVPIKDQDHGARQPVFMHASIDFYDGSYYPHITPAANMYTVPANKRLVIEYYTADIPALTAQRVRVSIQTTSAGNPIALYFLPLGNPIAFDPFGLQATSIGSGLIRIYCDAGATVHLNVSRNNPNSDTTAGDITLSGYLVDLLP